MKNLEKLIDDNIKVWALGLLIGGLIGITIAFSCMHLIIKPEYLILFGG